MLKRGFVFLSLVFCLAFVSCEQPVDDDPADGVVNAQTPGITVQPQGGTWDVSADNEFPLTVTASVTDGGTLSYQWYSNAGDSNSGGTAMPGATNAALPLAKANYTGDGPRYFYAVVTNTINDNGDGGQKTASVTSNAVTVTVTGNGVAAVNAQPPDITDQPQDGTWDVSADNEFHLTVTANSPDNGDLSYQWYSNATNAAAGGTAMPGATDATLTLAKTHYTGDGPRYFYAVVTNTITDNGDGGYKTATATSNAVTVMVTGNGVAAVNAQPPNITGQPQSSTWDVSADNEFPLTVTASVTDGGALSYQWYSNATNAAAGGTAMPGATDATLTLAKAHYTGDGPRYFYAVVTNTITDNGDGGYKTASVTGNAVTVMVTGNGVAAVNAQQPSITTQPQDGTWDVSADNEFHLTVTANSPDNGNLSYQWRSNASASNSGGTAIGTDNSALILQKANYLSNQDYYFYVVVTNTITDNGDGGNKTASVTGNAVTVTVTGNTVVTVNAQQPVIAAQPQSRTWDVFAADTLNLTVGASVTDGGTLSYQWYATLSPAIITTNNPVIGGTSATLSLNRENYTTDGARSYFFVQVKNTNTNVNGNQTATANSSVATVTITGNGELAYTTAPLPQELIGQWIASETVTISANEFSNQIPGWGGYGGTIVGHRSNGDTGYITIQYSQNDWAPNAIGKFYVIHYKELTSASMKYSGAFSTSDPDFAGEGGRGKATQDEAEKTYTLTGGYYTSSFGDNAYTPVVKVP